MTHTLEQERFARGLPPRGRHLDCVAACQKAPGDAAVAVCHVGRRAGRHHLAAPLARAGAKVDHPVGCTDCLFVVLDHDHGVALVAEGLQSAEQLDVVAGMQADRRLVEHVEHPREAGADLRGEPDPLALAAGERGRLAFEREVAEPDLVEERQPRADLLHQLDGDHRLRVVEDEVREKLPRRGDRQGTELVEGKFRVCEERLVFRRRGVPGLPPGAFIGRARAVA